MTDLELAFGGKSGSRNSGQSGPLMTQKRHLGRLCAYAQMTDAQAGQTLLQTS